MTYFKNDYNNDNDNEPDKFKNLDPRRAELAGKNVFSEEWIVVLILDLTKKNEQVMRKRQKKRKRLVEYKCVLLYRFIYADKEIHLHSTSYFIMFQLFFVSPI